MSTFNEKMFAFFGGLFREDDPVVTAAVVQITGVPSGSPATSADMNSGSLSNELQWNKAYTDQMTSYWNIDVAEGEFLDTLGADWLGLARYPGETDAIYSDRIRIYLTANRNTPWGLEQIMRIFSPAYVLIQEGLSGFGAVTRSFLTRYTDGSSGYDRTRPVLATTVVSGRTVAVFTVASSAGFSAGDEAWFNDGSTIKCYVVLSTGVGTVTVSERGYAAGYPKAATFAAAPAAVITSIGHGLASGDVVGVEGSTIITSGAYTITYIGPDSFSIPAAAAMGGTITIRWAYTDGILSFGGTTGTLTKYTAAAIMKAYIGSVSEGLLRIRITIESNTLTNSPIIARFLVEMAENSKIPGSRVEIRKV